MSDQEKLIFKNVQANSALVRARQLILSSRKQNNEKVAAAKKARQ